MIHYPKADKSATYYQIYTLEHLRETVYNTTNLPLVLKNFQDFKATVDLFPNILISADKEATSLNTRISKEHCPHEILERVREKRKARYCRQKIHRLKDRK